MAGALSPIPAAGGRGHFYPCVSWFSSTPTGIGLTVIKILIVNAVNEIEIVHERLLLTRETIHNTNQTEHSILS